jgi:L,D-peptidoglycan transpeptidase YkuD (ErfK/YbiS/YcfS/YnhG family)
MTVPHYNRVGSILDLKNQRQRDATVGKNPILYAQVDFLEKKKKKNYGPPLCVFFFFFFFFRNFNEKCPNLTESLPYNSGTTQNDFWIKETDKRAQNGDKKRPKTL